MESDSRRDLYSLNSDVGRSHPKKAEADSEEKSLCVSFSVFLSHLYAHRITGANKCFTYVLKDTFIFLFSQSPF